MDDAGPLTLLMNVGGPILLGLALALALWYTWRRRQDPAAQKRTDDHARFVRQNRTRANRRSVGRWRPSPSLFTSASSRCSFLVHELTGSQLRLVQVFSPINLVFS